MIFLKVLLAFVLIHLHYSYTLMTPISTCLIGCRSCDPKSINVCRSNLQPPCFQQFQLENHSCVLNNHQFQKYQMPMQALEQKCSYTSADLVKTIISVPSVFKKDQGYELNFAINQKQKQVSIYFQILLNEWAPFNDFLDILIQSGSNILFQGEISLQARPNINKSYAIDCLGVLMTARQYKVTLSSQKLQKINFVNSSGNIHIVLQGYMVLGKWTISNMQIVHPKTPEPPQQDNKTPKIPDQQLQSLNASQVPMREVSNNQTNQTIEKPKQEEQKIQQKPKQDINKEKIKQQENITQQNQKQENIKPIEQKNISAQHKIESENEAPLENKQKGNLQRQKQIQPKNLLATNYSETPQEKQTEKANVVQPFLISTEDIQKFFKIELVSMYHQSSRNKSLRIKLYDSNSLLDNHTLKFGIHGQNPYEQLSILYDMNKQSRVYDIYPTKNFQRKIIDLLLSSKQQLFLQDSEKSRKLQTQQRNQISKIIPYKGNSSVAQSIFQSIPVNRYDLAEQNIITALVPIQIYFQILLYVSIGFIILSVLFRRGYLFQELILSLQLIFLHAFIFSPYMPYVFKVPISSLFKSISLNYLPESLHLQLERLIIGDIIQDSPLKYTQFERDINFTRAFIPCLIICIFYAFWILTMKVLHFILQSILLKRSIITSNNLLGRFFIFLSKVSNRKMGFCYQVIRYMSLTIFWCTFVQLHNLNFPINSSQGAVPNTIICMFFFIMAISWPFAIQFYLKDQKNPNVRLDTLKDTMFLKNDPQNKYQAYYPFLTQVKYFLYALLIAYAGDIPLLVAITLIIVQMGQIIYVIYNDIFSNRLYLSFRILENLLFIMVKVVLMFMYGFSSYLGSGQYMKIGYVALGLVILISLNSIVRCLYLIFKKIAGNVKKPQEYYNQEMIGDFQPAVATERIF